MVASRLLMLTVALGAALSVISPARAQAGIELRHATLAEADFGAARLAGSEDGLHLRSGELAFARGRLAVGADYVYTHYDYSGLSTRDRDLHRLALPLVWSRETAHVARLTLTPTVAASSNVFKDLFSRGSGDDFRLYGRASVERAPAQGSGWRVGAAYGDAFGEPRAYPVLAWLRRGPRVALELGWPNASIAWRVRPPLRLRFGVAPAGSRWHVVSDERGGAEFFYTVEAWRGALGAEWTFSPRWRLDAELGYEFDRHHDFEDDTGARIDRAVDATGVFGLGLRYGF